MDDDDADYMQGSDDEVCLSHVWRLYNEPTRPLLGLWLRLL